MSIAHCRFDLGSGAVLIRLDLEFTAAINTAHIVNASRYAKRVNFIVISWYLIVYCIEWDKVVDCQWIIDHQLRVPLLVKLLN